MSSHQPRTWRRVLSVGATVALLSPLLAGVSLNAQAASSNGCEGGGFRLVDQASGHLGVRGTYISFDVDRTTFAIYDYAFTGAVNPQDITGGVRTPVFASKVPDHRGLGLTSTVSSQVTGSDLVLAAAGPGLTMKIQAKDCAQGGIFQMEPERGDGTHTTIVHTLATGSPAPFYFDNPFFRDRAGQFLGSECTSVATGPPSRFCVKVTPRVNIANDVSADFVARDSAQVATLIRQTGSASTWSVASGGRMGFVSGEDAVEVANPPTACVQNCQAQNRVRGRLVVLGFPFLVPTVNRLAN